MRAQPDSSNRHAAVVYNPIKVDLGRLRDAIEREAMRAGWSASRWIETTTEDAGQQAARNAVAGGASVIIAAGGDGTVRAVAEGLRDSRVPLAVVPVGTGNLLARNLDMPLSSLDASAAIAFGDAERSIDLGVLTAIGGSSDNGGSSDSSDSSDERQYCFLVMAGLGIDAAMMAKTSSALKAKVGWLAYVDGGVRSLPSLEKVRIRYSIGDGEPRTAHVSTILVANCGRLPGNIELFPDALVDDGELDIAMLQPKTLFGWLLIWRRVVWENRVLRRSALGRSIIRFSGPDKRRTISYLRGPSVEISVGEAQPFELDGDAVGEATTLRFTVDAGALIVKVPQPAVASSAPSVETASAASDDARTTSTG
ncbi:diacylglycerol kinase family protein [Microbacterium sp. STN6]|uniref:diacylglycerol/lipid kinase family protein n=1 Tax=Microbacterium sp. STN6 TaxID=2995588 RepID=UPI002260C692|nr:diacylglycerol kinase family protein [Microbacterium sp. STN6]MCX7522479.1 diacylglycerol kinase family protein [Microbacterium sp. STN6]